MGVSRVSKSDAIGTAHNYVGEEAVMFGHSRHDGVADKNVIANHLSKAELHSPDEPSDESNSYLRAAVPLRVVGCGLLLGDLAKVLALDLD